MALKNRQGANRLISITDSRSGFTIIELLIAIAIFGIVIPSMATGINNLIVLNNRTRDLALANLIAENKAEQVRNAGFNGLTPGTVAFSSELPAELSSPKSGSYTVTIPNPGLAEVVVNISYKDYSQTRSLQYKTLISELGIGQ